MFVIKCGVFKSIRFSILQRIINNGLGGHLEISIRLD